MRPCAGSRWRGDARTGTDGGVRRLCLHAPIRAAVAFDLRRSRCHFTFAVFLVPRFWLGVLGAEGIGDALVCGIGLPVDAVGADLEQDRDAVPGAAATSGRTPRSWAVEIPPRATNCRDAVPDGSRCRFRVPVRVKGSSVAAMSGPHNAPEWSAEREAQVLGLFRDHRSRLRFLASSRCPADGGL
jgi:hypothetical protein